MKHHNLKNNHHLKHNHPMDHDSPNQNTDSSQPDNTDNFLKAQTKKNKLIISLSVFGLILFILVASMATFKDQIFQALYPKPVSQAVDPIDDLTSQLLAASKDYQLSLTQSGSISPATPSATPVVTTPSATPTSSPTSLPQPTIKLASPSASPKESSPSAVQGEATTKESKEKLDKTIKIAKKRKELLLQKIKENPQEFLNKATLVDKRDTFADAVKPYIEQKVSVQGKLAISHSDDFENKKSTHELLLKDKTDQYYKLHLVEQDPQITPNVSVRVTGVEIDQEIAAQQLQIEGEVKGVQSQSGEVLGVQAPPLIGETKVAVLVIKFAQTVPISPEFTLENITNMIKNGSNSVKSFYETATFNQLAFSVDVFGIYTITIPTCNVVGTSDSVVTQANAAAAQAGVNLSLYDKKVYLFADPSENKDRCLPSGGAFLAGDISWVKWSIERGIEHIRYAVLHELGHNFDLDHANGLTCNTRSPSASTTCTRSEYAENIDVMGGQIYDFNGVHKDMLKVIPTSRIKTITQNGQYTIAPLEIATTSTQLLKIPTNSPITYYISYRQSLGNDDGRFGNPPLSLSLIPGASINVWGRRGFSGNSIETVNFDTWMQNPNGGSHLMSPLLVDNETFNDQVNNIFIKQISHNANSVTVEITIPAPISPIPPGAYQRAFVTSATYNGNLGGLTGADTKCQEKANAANLGGTWKAWLSDSQTSAASRLNHAAVPYKRLDGVTIANNWVDLTDGSIQNPLKVTEQLSTLLAGNFVWTNTASSGGINSATAHCNNWTDGITTNLSGFGGQAASTEFWSVDVSANCSFNFRLYCFEEPVKTPPCEIYGDLNLDGRVTVADKDIVLQIANGQIIPQVSTTGDTQYMSKVGDVNGDNSITSSDALLIDRYIQGLDATFPVCTNAKPPACNNLGDVTTNGNVTPMDAYEALRIVVGYKDSLYTKKPYTDDQKKRADVDGNGNVTVTDSSRISRYVTGTVTTFPACSLRRVFVTSTFYNGNLGGLSGADQKCQERATAANLGGTWMAWLSDSTNSPSTRFSETLRSTISPVTFKLVDKTTVIASSWNDLTDGSLQNPINKTEQNTTQSASRVWTNTKFNGTLWQSDPSKNCQNWTQAGPISGYTGVNNTNTSSWTEVAGFNSCVVDAAPIYCFEK